MSGSTIEVRRVAGRAGAEVVGVDLGGDVEEPVVRAVRAAVLEHKVVFVRGQGHLDHDAQEAFSARLGRLADHPTLSGDVDREYLASLTSRMGPRTNIWHSDITFVADYPAFTILRAVEIPPYGGETVWANTVAAYESLPPVLQRLADQLWAVHTNAYDHGVRVIDVDREEANRRFRTDIFAATEFETHHPLVRVHPETGERSLVLGAFGTRGFVGVDGADSRTLFQLFQRHITAIENTVRWRWVAGDVAIWDNRATQHYASHDYGDLPRRMDRTTVAGEWPVSVDGRESVVVRGGDHPWYAGGLELLETR